MTRATGFATHSALAMYLPPARTAIAGVIAAIVLTACGGGAATTENPLTQAPPPGDTPYTGPVARDSDVLRFQQEFWINVKTSNRCGGCHNEVNAQMPMFARNDDINLAYDAALTVVDTTQPALSQLVAKVGEPPLGHNCWNADPSSCATIMTTWIENWVGAGAGGGRQILLVPPPSADPGASKNFPDDPNAVGTNGTSFATTVYPVLEQYCSDCHSSESAVAQQPYFADPDIDAAYDAAKSKINLDTPANSRLVIRLRTEFHNCWSGNCANDAQVMENAIIQFANGIVLTTVDPLLVTSKALRLVDGTLASGGNRFEDAQIALWEFKTGSGTVAYDTSGVDPAIDLNFSGDVTWFGGWGITITDGKAQASTTSSAKLYDVIQESGEFSIEAWVAPANVTQEEARIVSYSAGTTQRNFTLQQTLYDYNFQLRTTETSLNGDPALSTPAMDEVLQATLQHVVATYDPINGRSIYVNGNLVTQTDPVPGGTLIDWQDTFAFVLGNEASGDGLWQGVVRLAAIHRRAMTPEQITQNYDAGVGERFYLMFDISENIAAAPQSSYILFEVAQYDTYAYLFDKPHFVTLDGSTPEGVPIQGVRVAMNGLEAQVGQTYATLDDTLRASAFGAEGLGQPLSVLGAVLPLEKGPQNDEFFLTFDVLAANSYNRPADPTLVITESNLVPASHIGLRTFDEINATYAEVTMVNPTTQSVDVTFQELRQSLPAVEDINTFLSSHQVAIAQLAIQYCDAMIGTAGNPGPNLGTLFPNFSWANGEFVSGRDDFVNPLIDRIMGTNLVSQPNRALVYEELAAYQDPTANDPVTGVSADRPDNLVDRLIDAGSDTYSIGKGVCAAMLGNAATLVQ